MLQVREGDLNKLGLLYERYKKVLFAFYYHQNRNAQVSEDLVQNVFYRVLKYRHGFRGDGVFKVCFFTSREMSAQITTAKISVQTWRISIAGRIS